MLIIGLCTQFFFSQKFNVMQDRDLPVEVLLTAQTWVEIEGNVRGPSNNSSLCL